MFSNVHQCLLLKTASSAELQVQTTLSQSAVSRQLRALDDQLVRIRQGRSLTSAFRQFAHAQLGSPSI